MLNTSQLRDELELVVTELRALDAEAAALMSDYGVNMIDADRRAQRMAYVARVHARYAQRRTELEERLWLRAR